MVRKWYRFFLIAGILLALAGWMLLILSNARAFFRGDRTSGLIALAMLGLLTASAIAGVTSYRRYQIEWQKRIAERGQGSSGANHDASVLGIH